MNSNEIIVTVELLALCRQCWEGIATLTLLAKQYQQVCRVTIIQSNSNQHRYHDINKVVPRTYKHSLMNI